MILYWRLLTTFLFKHWHWPRSPRNYKFNHDTKLSWNGLHWIIFVNFYPGLARSLQLCGHFRPVFDAWPFREALSSKLFDSEHRGQVVSGGCCSGERVTLTFQTHQVWAKDGSTHFMTVVMGREEFLQNRAFALCGWCECSIGTVRSRYGWGRGRYLSSDQGVDNDREKNNEGKGWGNGWSGHFWFCVCESYDMAI